jgi:hypothetical protein
MNQYTVLDFIMMSLIKNNHVIDHKDDVDDVCDDVHDGHIIVNINTMDL